MDAKLEKYLDTVDKHLKPLPVSERVDIVKEVKASMQEMQAAEVRLLERDFVKGGIVTIIVTGDVAAVKASVDAGAAAAARLGENCLRTQHVIPRPHPEVGECIVNPIPLAELREQGDCPRRGLSEKALSAEPPSVVRNVAESSSEDQDATTIAELTKENLDRLIESHGVAAVMNALASEKVVALRNLAREYDDLAIAGRAISKANKETLLAELTKHYEAEE